MDYQEDKFSSLPHNSSAEKSILGTIILDSSKLDVAREILIPSDFYHIGNQIIFQALIEYSDENHSETIDLVSIINYLKSHNINKYESVTMLEKCGGVLYVSSLTDGILNTSSLNVHCEIVKNLSKRREMILLSEDMKIMAFDESIDIADSLLNVGNKISVLEEGDTEVQKDRSVKPLLNQAVALIRERMKGSDSGNIETGFDRLDSMTDGGFHPTDFIIIAARPSIGKTAFCTSIIQHMIMKKTRVAFYSLEMSGLQVMQRLISSTSKVPLKVIRNAKFTSGRDVNFNRAMDAVSKIYDSELYIYDIPNMKLSDIRSSARKLKREHDIEIIFIDYIGLVDAGMPSNVPRHEQISYISRSLKAMARDLKIPVVVLCQVSRDAEGDKNEPQLNNLRDSGAIEQDADMVMFLHRSRKMDEDSINSGVQPTKVIVAKQRNGETGEFKIGFTKDFASFENISEDTPF